MALAGRSAEAEALGEARRSLIRPELTFLTADQAAEKLGVSVSTVESWVERGALAGGSTGGCCLVSPEGVDYLVRLRESLRELDREGNPTSEEIRELYSRPRKAPRRDAAAS